MEGVVGSTMSSTGFVSFLDLTTVACAASTPLTSKPQVLDVGVAPEPRDIIWQNAHISLKSMDRRENSTNVLLVIGGLLWIFPLTAIQAFSKAEYIAQIPGMEWILTANGGKVSQFVNGYLPVIALLCLIMILPVIFELVARNYERRKTTSDVQNSMLGRYFYYQVLNLYISVTAGSLWKSLAEILDHPTSILQLLGESLPFMVGYVRLFLPGVLVLWSFWFILLTVFDFVGVQVLRGASSDQNLGWFAHGIPSLWCSFKNVAATNAFLAPKVDAARTG